MGPLRKALFLTRRYFVTVAFPVVCFGSIYLDYSHTREFKRQLKLIKDGNQSKKFEISYLDYTSQVIWSFCHFSCCHYLCHALCYPSRVKQNDKVQRQVNAVWKTQK